jgi:hypothetical protein
MGYQKGTFARVVKKSKGNSGAFLNDDRLHSFPLVRVDQQQTLYAPIRFKPRYQILLAAIPLRTLWHIDC